MSDAELAPANLCVTSVALASDDWRRKLIAAVEVLHRDRKRAIVFIDGATIYVYRAENAGIIALK